MDLESLFLNHFAIEKKPDIIQLIKAAIQVGAWKQPTKFKKHKDEILMMLLNPETPGDIDEIDSASDTEEDEEEEDEVSDSGGVEFSVDYLHQTEKSSSSWFQETGHILGRQGNYNVSKAKSTVFKLSLKKTRDIDDKLQHKHVDSDKEKKTEVGKCLSDSTESKNMSCVTGSATKNSPGGLRKLNEGINRVEEKQDCSSQKVKRRLEGGGKLQKQRNCSAITRPNQKTTQNSTVARPMQKPALSSTVARPTQKPAQSSTVRRPTQKPAQSSTVGRPTQKPAQSSTVATPTQKPAQSSTVGRPTQKPAQSSTVATPTQKPAQSSTVGRPTQKLAQSSTVATPTQKPAQSSTVATPTQKPAQSSTVATAMQKQHKARQLQDQCKK
uniref:Myb-like protein V n=1 Tax=Nicotiana tabacum TaxID=4097 RepID=A0A1S3ZLM3_TOBAC|nr:PREDICTED: myb-like protein V [Nicotiana tabacum]